MEQIRKSLGKYDLVYTRSAEGRAILLDARIILANKQEHLHQETSDVNLK
ncbi:MAG: hypothetical protein ACLRG1_02785 [Streptococcus salivarius]